MGTALGSSLGLLLATPAPIMVSIALIVMFTIAMTNARQLSTPSPGATTGSCWTTLFIFGANIC